MYIQGVPGGKVNIQGGYSIGHSKQKNYMNIYPIPNGFRDFLLRMTDTVTSQNIDLSSWDTLYIAMP